MTEARRARSQDRNPRANTQRAPRRPPLRRVHPKKSSNKRRWAFLGVGVLLAVGLGFGISALLQPKSVKVSIHGESFELPRETTYSDLQKQGYLKAGAGDFLAIDGSVLEKGAGQSATIVSGGQPVDTLDEKIKADDDIIDIKGDNITETTTSHERVIPVEASLDAGQNFRFYGNTLHMPLEKGEEGLEVVEVGTVSGISGPTQTLKEMKPAIYGDYLPSFGDDKKVVAFTYDDGPDPTYTQQMLDVLDKHNVKATFFMLGTSVESYPDIAKKVADEGHQVASHSYSHASEHYLNKLDAEGVEYQVSTAQSIIKKATGVETKILRPPGGNLHATSALAGAPWVDAYVGWDIGTGDFNKPGTDYIVNAVRDKMHPGGIVLMHDGGGDRSQTVEASDILIGELLRDGYRFVTIDELIELTREEMSA